MAKCTDCKQKKGRPLKIRGRSHAKYKPNSIVKQEYFCELHWCERGQPEPKTLQD